MQSAVSRQKDKQRKKASHKWLDILYAKQNSLCHWCKSQTVIVRNIPRDKRIRLTSGDVIWRDGEAVFQGRIATIDHVMPIRDGGSNVMENLVLSCLLCNTRRTAIPKCGLIAKVCPDCLGPKPRKPVRCHKCGIKQQMSWLESHGWAEVASYEPGESKFRDPVLGTQHILRHACIILRQRLGKSES